MNVYIAYFNLEDITHYEFLQIADSAAPTFSKLRDFISKVSFCDEAHSPGGGIYTWSIKQAKDKFAASELFTGAVLRGLSKGTGITQLT